MIDILFGVAVVIMVSGFLIAIGGLIYSLVLQHKEVAMRTAAYSRIKAREDAREPCTCLRQRH